MCGWGWGKVLHCWVEGQSPVTFWTGRALLPGTAVQLTSGGRIKSVPRVEEMLLSSYLTRHDGGWPTATWALLTAEDKASKGQPKRHLAAHT